MSRVILVTSGKGGVGKTTVCANLACALSERGKRVIAVEGDIGLNNLDVILNAENKIIYDAGEVAMGKATVMQAIVKINDRLSLFPATTGALNVVTIDIFQNIIRELKQLYDYVLIDSPAGIEDNFHRSAVSADEAIIVTTPHITAVRDGYKTSKILSSYGIDKVSLVVNRVRGEYVADKSMLSPDEISKVMMMQLCGILPEDDFVNLYGLADLKNNHSDISYAYALLGEYIDGGERKIFDCVSQHKSIMGRIRRWLNI